MRIQTMSLEAHKRYYKANKFEKCFDKEIDTDSQGLSLGLRVGEVETEEEREKAKN